MAVTLLAFAGVASGAGVSRAGDSTCGSLSSGKGAPAASSELRDVGFGLAGEVWVVGDVLDRGTGGKQALMERYNRSRWSVIPSPYQSTSSNGLNSVSMASGGGWAVGYALKGGWTYQPLALRWDRTQWSLASPAQLVGHAYLTGVDTMTKASAWAVGFRTAADGTRRTLIEHASSGAWSQVVSPNDGTSATDDVLMAVAGTSATGLWAVGYRESPAGVKPLVLRYNTALPSPSWVSVSGAGGVPSPGTVETVLTGLAVRTASDVWAVGYYDGGGGKRPLALHWNGSNWSTSSVPGVGLLRQVSAVAPGNVWAAGTYQGAGTRTLVVHFDGTTWATVKSADSAGKSDELIGRPTRRGRRSPWWAGRAQARSSSRRTARLGRCRSPPGHLHRFRLCHPFRASAPCRLRRRRLLRRSPPSR
jgi:hypothetical protein